MDPSRFDALSRAVLSRRHALLGSALFALLARVVTGIDASAEEVQAEACIPNGPVCGQRKGRHTRHGKRHGKRHGRRRDKKRGQRCGRCCSGCTAGTNVKRLRCACCPAAARCTRGDQCCSGSCRGGMCEGLDSGPDVCPTPTTPSCNVNPQSCGPGDDNCACFATTSGANGCFANQFVCYEDKTTCNDDADCLGHFGAGFGCVSTSGCTNQCGGNRNACYAPCDG